MPQPTITYRQLIETDLDEYKRAWLECLKTHPGKFGWTYDEGLSEASLKLSKAITNADDTVFAFGAFNADSTLIGICGFIGEKRMKAKHRGEIVQMFVDPDYNGQGVGKALLQLCIDKAFESGVIEQIVLSAVAENESAIGLYKKLGFVEYGRLEKFFKAGPEYSAQTFMCLMK